MIVKIKYLISENDNLFIKAGHFYNVKRTLKIDNNKIVGYIISTPRNEWVVSLDQVIISN